MEVQFLADILKLECKIGPTQDQIGRMNLEFIPDDDIFQVLKQLYKPDCQVLVTVSSNDEE